MIPLTLPERIQAAVGRAVVALPQRALDRALPAPVTVEGNTLDRQIQAIIAMDQLVHGRRPFQERPLPVLRRQLDFRSQVFADRPAPPLVVTRVALPGPAGALRARLYRPRLPARDQPALVYFHGGGFVLGSLDSHDGVCRTLAREADCAVLAIDYRLAPEHPFPAAVEDAQAAFRAVWEQAASFGLDPSRLAVGGDSAGGNLAAVVAQQARSGPARPRCQLLIYPALDMTMTLRSIDTFARGYLLEKEEIAWFRARYLQRGEDLRDPLASPLHAADLRGLAPAVVVTAGFDPLRDEGDAYAERLRAAGVPVTHRCYGPLPHGFINTAGSVRGARAALQEVCAALRAGLGG